MPAHSSEGSNRKDIVCSQPSLCFFCCASWSRCSRSARVTYSGLYLVFGFQVGWLYGRAGPNLLSCQSDSQSQRHRKPYPCCIVAASVFLSGSGAGSDTCGVASSGPLPLTSCSWWRSGCVAVSPVTILDSVSAMTVEEL
ncbi:hypothetical protein P171DRAFT_179992 [Karstenula rhodostoma CBS 690.94]|uniref:Uncharacterized protein n=1 Tax=Karstenula rhodostoma CBS 690.94 TaxID=1392251 RepID=A0A9P4U5G1_9PLEO|nr:hypothetical protein P171DRAFT_179992 [Karstenula rhodostoma CBS 690.94]